MQFSRQEYWNGLPFPPPGDLPNPRIKPASQVSPALASGLFTTSTTWEALQPRELRPNLLNALPRKRQSLCPSSHCLVILLWCHAGTFTLLVATTLAKSIKTTIKVVICLHSCLHSVKNSSQHDIVGIGYPLQYSSVSLVAQLVKNPPAMQETWVRSLDWEDPPEKGKATHYSILAWRIPRTV